MNVPVKPYTVGLFKICPVNKILEVVVWKSGQRGALQPLVAWTSYIVEGVGWAYIVKFVPCTEMLGMVVRYIR